MSSFNYKYEEWRREQIKRRSMAQGYMDNYNQGMWMQTYPTTTPIQYIFGTPYMLPQPITTEPKQERKPDKKLLLCEL